MTKRHSPHFAKVIGVKGYAGGGEVLKGLVGALRNAAKKAEPAAVELAEKPNIDVSGITTDNLPATVPAQLPDAVPPDPLTKMAEQALQAKVSRRDVLKRAGSSALQSLLPTMPAAADSFAAIASGSPLEALGKVAIESAAPAASSFETAALPGIIKAIRAVFDNPTTHGALGGEDYHAEYLTNFSDPAVRGAIKSALRAHLPAEVAKQYGITPGKVAEFAEALGMPHMYNEQAYDLAKESSFEDLLQANTPYTGKSGLSHVLSVFPSAKGVNLRAADEQMRDLYEGQSFSELSQDAGSALNSYAHWPWEEQMQMMEPHELRDLLAEQRQEVAKNYASRNADLSARAKAYDSVGKYRTLKDASRDLEGLNNELGEDYAEGGSVDPQEGSAARAKRNAPGFMDAMGALSDMVTGAAHGAASATLGWPGDLEGLLSDLTGARTPGESTFFPTTKQVSSVLPSGTQFSVPSERNPYTAIGENAPLGPGTAAKGARGALEAVAEALTTPPGRRLAEQGAVRLRGGNFYPYELGSYLGNDQLKVPETPFDPPWSTEANLRIGEDLPTVRAGSVADWAKSQLANYIRKDMGSPTDPLLQVEKEYPNLHLPADALNPNINEDLAADAVYGARGRQGHHGRNYRYLAEHQKLTSPNEPALGYTNGEGQFHHYSDVPQGGLYPDVPVTPWGYLSDQAMIVHHPDSLLTHQLPEALDFGTWTPEMGASDGYLQGVEAARQPKLTPDTLKKFLEHPNNAPFKQFGWLADADPKTKIWGLQHPAADPLHFGHVLDYLDAATEPHRRIEDWIRPNQTRPDAGITLQEALAYIQREGGNSMLPLPTRDMVRWKGLMDAGLTLDPRSLGRLSVADAVRKTAQWNEHLANQMQEVAPGLARGIKAVHKEYPEDGMRWVELGQPENLPEGWSQQHDQLANASEYVSPSGKVHTNHPGLEDLRAGLNAEGQAMGHCVGGYCDEVAQRGTKIYSLRDKNNNPHVTVEVSGKKHSGRYFYEQPEEERMKLLSKYAEETGDKAVLTGTVSGDFLNWLDNKLPGAQNIVQIKGKQNAAPVAKYLPQVQDFVKSGKWGRVGDLENARLRKISDVFNEKELKALKDTGAELPSEYLTAEEHKALADHYYKNITVPVLKQKGLYSPQSERNDENFGTGGTVRGEPAVRSRFEAALLAARR